jgi:hypothetical protein
MWINHHLAPGGNTILDLNQLGDGVTLPYLAEVRRRRRRGEKRGMEKEKD